MRRTDPATIARLRELRELGMPLKDIAAWLGIAPSTAYVHTKDIPVPPREQWRPAVRLTKGSLHLAKLAEIAECDTWARDRVAALSDDAFFAAGIALYAGEGSKTDGCVVFANTNPLMVAAFCGWLRRYFEVDESRLRGRLYLHEGLDYENASTFWADLTGIPVSQFHKPYRAAADQTIRRSKHAEGCFSVVYGCSKTHRLVVGLCRALLSSWPRDPA